jgi:alanyl-tRNA synthetase
LKNTGAIERFAVTSEESVSKGIRRLVALSGSAASAALKVATDVDQAIVQARKMPETDLSKTVNALQKQLGGDTVPLRAKRRGQAAVAELQAKLKAFEKSQKSSGGTGVDAVAAAGELLASATSVGAGKVIVGEIPGASDEQLRSAMDSLKKKSPSHGIMLAAAGDGKVNFVAAVSDDLIAKGLKAGDWIRETAKVAGGGGGGRPQMAQAGGKDPAKLPEALKVAREFASAKLS